MITLLNNNNSAITNTILKFHVVTSHITISIARNNCKEHCPLVKLLQM